MTQFYRLRALRMNPLQIPISDSEDPNGFVLVGSRIMACEVSRVGVHMGLLEWRTEYSIGVASVDQEHRELIELINVLYEHMDARSSKSEIESSLGDIYKAIVIHFLHEERLMKQMRYVEYQPHKNDHEALLGQLNDLMDAFVSDPLHGSRRLEEEMSAWFMQHFATHDARLHHHVTRGNE